MGNGRVSVKTGGKVYYRAKKNNEEEKLKELNKYSESWPIVQLQHALDASGVTFKDIQNAISVTGRPPAFLENLYSAYPIENSSGRVNSIARIYRDFMVAHVSNINALSRDADKKIKAGERKESAEYELNRAKRVYQDGSDIIRKYLMFEINRGVGFDAQKMKKYTKELEEKASKAIESRTELNIGSKK